MLSEYNIKIIYRPDPSNNKVDILIRIPSSKPLGLEDERVRQQYQIILIPNRLELDEKDFSINVIDDLIYYRVYNLNRTNELYTKIRKSIIDDKAKLREITLAKYSIQDEVLYYNNRLQVPDSIFAKIIREVYN